VGTDIEVPDAGRGGEGKKNDNSKYNIHIITRIKNVPKGKSGVSQSTTEEGQSKVANAKPGMSWKIRDKPVIL